MSRGRGKKKIKQNWKRFGDRKTEKKYKIIAILVVCLR